MKAHDLARAALSSIFSIFLCLALAGRSSAQGTSNAPQGLQDSSLVRIVAGLVGDSLGRMRDSIRTGQLSAAATAPTDPRPARQAMRAVDPSLFASTSGSVGDDYPMGPGDELVLSIWGQKQAQYNLLVDRDGQVQIPSAGSLSLNGSTFGEARRAVGRKLSAIYSGVGSGTTQYDLTLAKLKQIRVFVVGEVARPGGYVLQGASSSMQAVALAGGPTPRGSDRVAIVTNGTATTTVDLYEYLFLGRRPSGDILRDGSVVRVPPALGSARVVGAVPRPGSYEVVSGETTQSLLALAGGLAHDGSKDAPMNLVRAGGTYTNTLLVGPGASELGGSPSHPVAAGDVLEVPRALVSRRGSPVVTGAVARPGTYPWKEGLTLRELLSLAGGLTNGSYKERVVVFRTDSRGQSFVLSTSTTAATDTRLQYTDSVVVGDVAASVDSGKTVSIGGAVRHPVTVLWGSGLRLKDLVVLAGGWQPWADPSRVRIDLVSPDGKSSSTKIVSLDTTLGASAQDQDIPGAAVIHVPGDQNAASVRRISIQGLVAQPGTHALLTSRERVAAVVARIGGLLPDGYASGATLHRPTEGRIPFDLAKAIRDPGSDDNVQLLNGDSLHVPHAPATVRVEGQVHRPVATLWRKGKGADWYVRNAGGMTDSAMADGMYVVYADGSVGTADDGLKDPTPGSVVVVPARVPPPKSTPVEKINAFATVVSAVGAVLTVYLLYTQASDK